MSYRTQPITHLGYYTPTDSPCHCRQVLAHRILFQKPTIHAECNEMIKCKKQNKTKKMLNCALETIWLFSKLLISWFRMHQILWAFIFLTLDFHTPRLLFFPPPGPFAATPISLPVPPLLSLPFSSLHLALHLPPSICMKLFQCEWDQSAVC